MKSDDFEKLGAFYLGRPYDLGANRAQPGIILYDSKDLVTHAVCVGMTGSGKTGLCIGIVEEAAIDGIPAILIDPKGDLANLMLTFPDLAPRDFEPWVNAEEAASEGVSPPELAARKAETWKKGLEEWGQDGTRVRRLKEAAEVRIYTPGSRAGIPVGILRSFRAPPPGVIQDAEALSDRVSATASALLSLAGISEDPIQSREHILVSNILQGFWSGGKDLELGELITLIQQPPFTRVGVMEVDSFFPAKDRFALALSINNLLAAPGFQTWLEGEPMDVASFLYDPQGKPRVSIFSIAHLDDSERMFFVSLLLSEVLSWTRTQSGTASLRALLYMDEIYGYFPPVANPPSKAPLLTLLKQARAFGVGIVLATQNPVDLDYKGLSNTGTWLIGRLQTARDKERLLDGLEGASAGARSGFDRAEMDRLLSGLGKRIFFMNNVHEDAPVVLESRCTLSYLAGPLTLTQIKVLMDGSRPPVDETPESQPVTAVPAGAQTQQPAPVAKPAGAPPEPANGTSAQAPVLPPGINQYFLPLRGAALAGSALMYMPMLFGSAEVHFADSKSAVDSLVSLNLLTPITPNPVPVDWNQAETIELSASDLETEPEGQASFGELPPAAAKSQSYSSWEKDLLRWVYGSQKLDLLRSPSLKMVSQPGESESDFRLRLQQAGRERRDAATEGLRSKYSAKTASLQERIRRAEQAVEREAEQYREAKMQTAVSIGATVLGAFLGRKGSMLGGLGRATTAARGASRSVRQAQDVDRAEETVDALRAQLAELEAQFRADADAVAAATDPMTEELQPVTLKPKKADISVRLVSLVWAPRWVADGQDQPAW